MKMELMASLVDTRSKMRRRAGTEAVRLIIVVESVADVIAEWTCSRHGVVCNIIVNRFDINEK